MSKEIDWSKAPEGATHFNPIGPNFQWYKKTGDYWYAFDKPYGNWIRSECSVSFYAQMVPRYAAWNGTGLPPVGSTIEYKHKHHDVWRAAVVNYASDAYLILVEDGTAVEQHYHTSSMDFRPIRTPEQIAAEVREKTILKMMADYEYTSGRHTYDLLHHQAERLYDIGYRKIES